MNYRKQILILLIIAVILWSISYYIAMSCLKNDFACNYEALITPFFLGMPALFLVSFILLFTRKSIYFSWRKFARWAIPIGAIILFLVPADSPGGWISGPDLTKETASWGVSIAFLLISLIIIVRKSLQKKNK